MASTSLSDLFAERLFVIPDYQRGYAWEGSHRQALFDDIDGLPASTPSHFMGLMVLAANGAPVHDASRNQLQPFHVVDGQQRLTSLVLLTDALARAYDAIGDARAAAELRVRFVFAQSLNGMSLLRLKPARHDASWWRDAVLGDEPPVQPPDDPTQRRMWLGRQQFDELLERKHQALGVERWRDWLDGFRDTVTRRLRFAVFEADSQADVGVIFEVMNDRGKPLTSMEKVKNHLLLVSRRMSLPTEGLVERILDAWRRVYQRLDAGGLHEADDDVLRTHWLITVNPDARRWSGYASVKAWVTWLREDRSEAEVVERLERYVSTLDDACFAYVAVTKPDEHLSFAGWGALEHDARTWGRKLHRMNRLANLRPFLVAVRMACRMADPAYLDALRAAERYAFRVYAAMECPAHTGRAWILREAHRVWLGELPVVDAGRTLDRLAAAYAPDDKVEEKLAEEGDWFTHWARHLRYFLYEYEEHVAGNHGPKLQWKDASSRDYADTIEHVYPQTPKDQSWTSVFATPSDRALKHDLGNLVLTARSANSAYSNKPFLQKRGKSGQAAPCYANGIYQEMELTTHASWTPSKVRKRHKQLTAWAMNRWALPSGTTAEEADPDDDGPGDE